LPLQTNILAQMGGFNSALFQHVHKAVGSQLFIVFFIGDAFQESDQTNIHLKMA
jgi:hypothetical protein